MNTHIILIPLTRAPPIQHPPPRIIRHRRRRRRHPRPSASIIPPRLRAKPRAPGLVEAQIQRLVRAHLPIGAVVLLVAEGGGGREEEGGEDHEGDEGEAEEEEGVGGEFAAVEDSDACA